MLLQELHTPERQSGCTCSVERGGDTALKSVTEWCGSSVK